VFGSDVVHGDDGNAGAAILGHGPAADHAGVVSSVGDDAIHTSDAW